MLEGFTWFTQSAFRWVNDGMVVYIDPWGVDEPIPADLIFVTHAHYDHFVPEQIAALRRDDTVVVAPADIAAQLPSPVRAVQPGDSFEIEGIGVEVVHAYTEGPGRERFHPKENRWAGYVLSAGGITWYHAGDTDHVVELDAVRADLAFLPIGGTYTMDAVQAGGLARAIAPSIAVPMHFGFVTDVGDPEDVEVFRRAASPIRVEMLEPVNVFGSEGWDD